MDVKTLSELAVKAMKMAYAPYSGYQVGAALLGESGKVYCGCNIENAAHTATSCAERTAFFKAISEGERRFTAIAVCGGKDGVLEDEPFPPCGVCRQVMREFCEDSFQIHMVKKDDVETVTLAELLPYSFRPSRISREI